MDAANHLRLNATQLKLIACASMLIDHIGLLLLPQHIFLRCIGRLAFPIFAYLIANGYRHTRSRGRYLLRLGVFALLFQPVYAYCMPGDGLSIFATLALGLLAIVCWERALARGQRWLAVLSALLLSVGGELLGADYGAYGVLLIVLSQIFFANAERLCTGWVALNLLFIVAQRISALQIFSLAALPLLLCYNGEAGRGWRWAFYAFYCLHIPALWYIATLL